MKTIVWIGTLLAAGSLLLLSRAYESFAWIFWVPGALLILVQIVATSSLEQKDKLFAVTDYVYYIGVGAVLGVGSHFLSGLDEASEYYQSKAYADAVAELPLITSNLIVARQRKDESIRAVSLLDPELAQRCLGKQLSRQNDTARPVSLGGRNVPEGCETTVAVMDALVLSSKLVDDLAARKSKLERIIRRTESEGGQVPLLPKDIVLLLLYQVFPAVLLCGVALKIGKTTHAFLK